MSEMAATQLAPDTDTSVPVPAPAALGLVASGIDRRQLAGILIANELEPAAVAPTVESLLDKASGRRLVTVISGEGEMLARGGSVELLRTLRPDWSIVLVCDDDGAAIVRKALRAGIDGFVSRSSADQTLLPTIEAVIAGQLSVPKSIRSRVTWGTFSIRERQVLQLVAAGLTNAEIADRLYLSESTVKSHLSSSFKKLGVSSRAEAAAVVLDPENGLDSSIPTPPVSVEQELLAGA